MRIACSYFNITICSYLFIGDTFLSEAKYMKYASNKQNLLILNCIGNTSRRKDSPEGKKLLTFLENIPFHPQSRPTLSNSLCL